MKDSPNIYVFTVKFTSLIIHVTTYVVKYVCIEEKFMETPQEQTWVVSVHVYPYVSTQPFVGRANWSPEVTRVFHLIWWFFNSEKRYNYVVQAIECLYGNQETVQSSTQLD